MRGEIWGALAILYLNTRIFRLHSHFILTSGTSLVSPLEPWNLGTLEEYSILYNGDWVPHWHTLHPSVQ